MERRGFLAGLLGLPVAKYLPTPKVPPPIVVSFSASVAGLNHLSAVLYKKKALERLQTTFQFRHITAQDIVMRPMWGRKITFNRYGQA